MKTCNKTCIANVGGKCAVQDCRGPISRLDGAPISDLERAAKFYDLLRDAFDDYFGGNDHA